MYDIIFDDVGEYFATCPWMDHLYRLKYGLKKIMNFILNVGNKPYFVKNSTKEIGLKQFMLVSFKTI
jgi:hypothetical protein